MTSLCGCQQDSLPHVIIVNLGLHPRVTMLTRGTQTIWPPHRNVIVVLCPLYQCSSIYTVFSYLSYLTGSFANPKVTLDLPLSPVSPVRPVGPLDPVAPVGPCGPRNPLSPVGPVCPVGPLGPVGP